MHAHSDLLSFGVEALEEIRLDRVAAVSCAPGSAPRTHRQVVLHWLAVRPGTQAASSSPFLPARTPSNRALSSAALHALPLPDLRGARHQQGTRTPTHLEARS